MYDLEFLHAHAIVMAPFKDQIVVLSKQQDLYGLRDFLVREGYHDNGYEGFDELDSNFGIVTLHTPGASNTHILYLPVIERQKLGGPWLYMLSAITRMLSVLTLRAVKTAGYNPTTESAMYAQLHARMLEKVLLRVQDFFGGELHFGNQAAMDLSATLIPQQWHYIDQLTPRTISDLARQQLIIEEDNQVFHRDDGWSATTYYY